MNGLEQLLGLVVGCPNHTRIEREDIRTYSLHLRPIPLGLHLMAVECQTIKYSLFDSCGATRLNENTIPTQFWVVVFYHCFRAW